MDAGKYNKVVECLGKPIEKIEVNVPIIGVAYSSSKEPNGTHQNGEFQYLTVPLSGTYRLVARGASGSLGSYIRAGTTKYISDPGHGAIVTAEFFLDAGDELLIIVGQQGYNQHTSNSITDGAGGASGGGTFIFRKIASITDDRYQITIKSQPYECLLVAAGGGGTQDNSYRRSTANGYDAAEEVYSLSNFKAYSTQARTPVSAQSFANVLGLMQIQSWLAVGSYYMRNNEYGYGGYGCGSCADDNYSMGGGWSASSISYRTASWARDGGTIEIASDFGDGTFGIILVGTKEVYAWWTPVTDRIAADCVYGNPKGCVNSVFLNRVESDADFLFYLLDQYHLKHETEQEVDTVWERTLYLRYKDLKRIRTNLDRLWSTSIVEQYTAEPMDVESKGGMTYVLANTWELTMADMKSILDGIAVMRRPLGTFECGATYLRQKLYTGY